MILKKDLGIESDTPAPPLSNSKGADKHSDASSSTLCKYLVFGRMEFGISVDLANTCRSTEFSCRDGTCIPYYDVCNTYEDCPSGIDEAMCSPGIDRSLLCSLSWLLFVFVSLRRFHSLGSLFIFD